MVSFLNRHFVLILKDPSGLPQRRWINEISNEGFLRYSTLLNTERLFITSPAALGEILVRRSYDFIKPPFLRDEATKLLAAGVLLAEGNEHRVSTEI